MARASLTCQNHWDPHFRNARLRCVALARCSCSCCGCVTKRCFQYRKILKGVFDRGKRGGQWSRNTKMSQPNQNNNPESSGDTPLKRKRGRPRKYPRADLEESPYASKDQNMIQNRVIGEHARAPSGFGAVNGNQPHQREENDSDGAMVGQAVSGVIEAVFDAGYLLCVKVENSDTILRGLVFKPGSYVPITAQNDVAPGVPMIQRNAVPFPSVTYTRVQNTQPKERNEQNANVHRNETHAANGPPAAGQVSRATVSSNNSVASQSKKVSPMAEQTAHPLGRGSMIPVATPANFSNGVPASNQLPQVITPASLGSRSNVTKEIPVVGNQAPLSQIQTSQNMSVKGIQNKGDPHGLLDAEERKSLKLAPNVPSENLVTEAMFMKRIQTPAAPVDLTLMKDPSTGQEEKANDNIDEALLITPLQAVQGDKEEHSISASEPMDKDKSGKMAELLQALQDNTMENQVPKAEMLGSGH
ncbi:hypothetical protein L6164_029402 [Bauhinia variegata]|uniref:Uncharacterized protein n=1 Tax=Bauhinia variegata TaxID=167791 RepID=A0ACB9L8P9_BAUVA|nr:hypothetical protein L6164_029402 [Bauhinia variegata]